jgi:hypothetical protein
VQDPHILLGRTLRPLLTQHVIGQAEAATGEQVSLVAIVGKGPRLAHQPVDDMPIVDAMLAPTTQPRQILHPPLGVPHLDTLGVQPGLHLLADQAARHRVDVALHADGAATLDKHTQAFARLQTPCRQRPQHCQLLGQAGLAVAVGLGKLLPQEGRVRRTVGEVAAAPQQQRLVQGPLELVVALLDVAVFVALAGLYRLASQAVVPQQRLVALLERPRPLDARLDGCRQPIRAVQLGHAAQFPQGVLQALAEALQALGETDRARLPIGVGEHEVVDQVGERASVQRHAQVGAMGEVAGGQSAGIMHLGEEHLLGRSAEGTPAAHAPLQGA